jgi:hypothetical protein
LSGKSIERHLRTTSHLEREMSAFHRRKDTLPTRALPADAEAPQ